MALKPTPDTLPRSWSDPEYRHGYTMAQADSLLCCQLRITREARGLTRRELAKLAKVAYSTIWRLENVEVERVNLKILGRISAALDVSFTVQLMPFSRLHAESKKLSIKHLTIAAYADEIKPV